MDETGVLDYGQQPQHHILINTLETKLAQVVSEPSDLSQPNEDIISLDGSETNMDILNEEEDSSHGNLHNNNYLSLPSHHTRSSNNVNETNDQVLQHASHSTKDASSLYHPHHVITSNASHVISAADVINHVIEQHGVKETLNDSIHAPKPTPIINLPPRDLRYKLNKIRHDKTSEEKPSFALIPADQIPGTARLDKIDFITTICQHVPGYNDLNWLFHNDQAQIALEFINRSSLNQAQQLFNKDHPTLSFHIVEDFRQLLSPPRPHSHQHRFPHTSPSSPPSTLNANVHNDIINPTDGQSYRLRRVPNNLHINDIQRNLSYYGSILNIQLTDSPPHSNFMNYIIIFDQSAKLALLNIVWSVNIKGYNISIAPAHLSDTQIAYRKEHVAGFKGFPSTTTASQALRTLRPYGGLNCYFHQNIAYIAFKSADIMHRACKLRLYYDEHYLIQGLPRLHRNSTHTDNTPPMHTPSPRKSMTRQTPKLTPHTLSRPNSPHRTSHPTNPTSKSSPQDQNHDTQHPSKRPRILTNPSQQPPTHNPTSPITPSINEPQPHLHTHQLLPSPTLYKLN